MSPYQDQYPAIHEDFNPFDNLPRELREALHDAVRLRGEAVRLEADARAKREAFARSLYLLRVKGVSMRRIAAACGVSRGRVQQLTAGLQAPERPWASRASGGKPTAGGSGPGGLLPRVGVEGRVLHEDPAGPSPGTGTRGTGTQPDDAHEGVR
jgi:hypothetical protein